MHVRECVCTRVYACVSSKRCACMRACARDVFAIYDNNTLPRLIMIIIKNHFPTFHRNRTH